MGDFSYRDDYEGHRVEGAERAQAWQLPPSLELDRFEDGQLLYLAEWLEEYRTECLNRILEYLSRPGARYRIIILDKLLNRPQLRWSDAAQFYGVSQHKLYDAKRELAGELDALARRLGLYVRRREGQGVVKPKKKKVKPQKKNVKQMVFGFYE